MERHTITLHNHLKNLSQLFLFGGGFILLAVFGPALGLVELDSSFLIAFGGLFGVNLLFVTIIHLNYYFVNRFDEIEFSPSSRVVYYKHLNKSITFSEADIKSIIYYKSYSAVRGTALLLAWDIYNHAVIQLQDGTKLIITSLLVEGNMNLPFGYSKSTTNPNLFRCVKGHSFK